MGRIVMHFQGHSVFTVVPRSHTRIGAAARLISKPTCSSECRQEWTSDRGHCTSAIDASSHFSSRPQRPHNASVPSSIGEGDRHYACTESLLTVVTNSKGDAWGITYARPDEKTLFYPEHDLKGYRQLWWMADDWRPESELHKLFRNIGRNEYGESLIEHWGGLEAQHMSTKDLAALPASACNYPAWAERWR
ncbi:hypothetical protein BU25DRAFT_408383 [Macroventuria anomochaeta]|uniref:Uncharacterized protein n=1 Tax=Macroventuria anomochaeta TaxID=301207 RepID=A0ACB6SA37_9PLEO|nr:uncharacterized protein BU25DRAFT_408383 [Macroventuria anomochaeta]KAF2630445.1 hypothetical protein BU25DRAFT_408383 [Macroventuria anomochaeta]